MQYQFIGIVGTVEDSISENAVQLQPTFFTIATLLEDSSSEIAVQLQQAQSVGEATIEDSSFEIAVQLRRPYCSVNASARDVCGPPCEYRIDPTNFIVIDAVVAGAWLANGKGSGSEQKHGLLD